MSKIYSVWDFIRRHKYLVVVLFFGVMVGFVDENSFWERRQRIQEINALKTEMRGYQNQFERDTKALEALDNSKEEVVRVARERYLMKYPGEDIYVVMDTQEERVGDEETLQN